jgi:hypothetical protein
LRDDERVKVRFSHGLVDYGVFDLGAVPQDGQVVLLPGTAAQLRVWSVAWRLDSHEPAACVFLMAGAECLAEVDSVRRQQ